MYKIKYFYKTGNSFGSSNEEDYLELTWEKKEIARDALRRIKEHYIYYKEKHKYYLRTPEEKEINARIIKEAAYKDWFVDDDTLIIKTDDNKDFEFWPPWCGYFEALYSAEIVSYNSTDKITF